MIAIATLLVVVFAALLVERIAATALIATGQIMGGDDDDVDP